MKFDLTLDAADHSEPVAGYYAGQMCRGGPRCPVRIWHGPPIDWETGDVLDRSHRWQAERCGQPVDINAVWPFVARDAITFAHYDHLLREAAEKQWTDPGYYERAPDVAGDCDMMWNFEWEMWAGKLRDETSVAAAHQLKLWAPAWAARTFGYGVEVRRAVNGAARVVKMEVSNAE